MKKLIPLLLAALLIISTGACAESKAKGTETAKQRAETALPAGQTEGTSAFGASHSVVEIPLAESPFKTLGDALGVEAETYQSLISENKDKYVYVFPKDGRYYRVEAEMTRELADQLDAIDFFDEEREKKMLALLGAQPVIRVYDLSAGMPSQAELDTLIGKTGRELLDMGFEYGSGYNFWGKAEVYLTKGLYEYLFYFNETVQERENYDEALDEIMETITVAKVEFFTVTAAAGDIELVY